MTPTRATASSNIPPWLHEVLRTGCENGRAEARQGTQPDVDGLRCPSGGQAARGELTDPTEQSATAAAPDTEHLVDSDRFAQRSLARLPGWFAGASPVLGEGHQARGVGIDRYFPGVGAF
ncbi:hypothetical protein GCM10023222_20840 [Saccharopolyspora cebuensis]